MYQILIKILKKFLPDNTIFKYGFNLSPMYRRSVGRVTEVSADLLRVKIEIPLNYKNRNLVGATFGGSLFSATDPIYMIQLMEILGPDYVVWDKTATIRFKRPVRGKVFATFIYTPEEIESIKQRIRQEKEINLEKQVFIVDSKEQIYSEVDKVLYVATKKYYLEKLARRKQKTIS